MAARQARRGLGGLAAVLLAAGLQAATPASAYGRPVPGAEARTEEGPTSQRAPALTRHLLARRMFVVTFAGRRPHRVSASAAAYNLSHFGVRTPAQVVRRYQPGGVIYFADNVGTVRQVRRLSDELRAAAARNGYRLLIMTDQEGGQVSRLPGSATESQPSAESYYGRTVPARRDARAVGESMRRMGVRVNLAPVADVNTVGDDGVIQDRSFGSTADVVVPMVRAQVCGYHQGGVATTLKHWPGHGSTRSDSHHVLPTLELSTRRWKRVHVPPFRAGIDRGTDLVMVGHLAYPAVDPTGRPASLSPVLNRQWLRGRLDFTGLVITDALDMGALSGFGDSGRLAVRAVRAGSDLLLMPAGPRSAAEELEDAVRAGTLDRAVLETSVRRVRRLQDRLGLVDGPRVLAGC